MLAAKLENEPERLAEALTQALENSRVDIASRAIPFAVSNGDVKVDAFSIDGPLGSARVATIVSLTSLAIDSVWQVTAQASPMPPPPEALPDWKPAQKGPLPAVTFVYTGSIGDLAQLQVKVDPRDLQRELQVRQMERKLEELDALRKRDEDRVRQEQERRKALEAERAAAAAAPPPQGAGAAATAARRRSGDAAGRANAAVPMPPVAPETNAQKVVPQAAQPDDAAVAPAAAIDPATGKAPVAADPPIEPAAVPNQTPIRLTATLVGRSADHRRAASGAAAKAGPASAPHDVGRDQQGFRRLAIRVRFQSCPRGYGHAGGRG